MKKFLPLVILLVFIFANSGFAQPKVVVKQYKKPAVIVDVFGGYNMPLMDLKGNNIGEFYNFQNYAVTGGYGFGYTVKATVANFEKSQFRAYATFAYGHYTASENYAYLPVNGIVFPPGWPNGSNYVAPVQKPGTSYLRLNMPQLAIGSEFSIFVDEGLKSSFSFGLDMNFVSISGRVFDTPDGSNEIFNTFHSNLRMGFGINTQYNFRVSDAFGFNAGMRFSMLNLFGKATELTDLNGYMFLNDAKNPAVNPLITNTRQMATFNFFGGVSFYIGTRK